jgi:hypothetical protein
LKATNIAMANLIASACDPVIPREGVESNFFHLILETGLRFVIPREGVESL